jgi:hypothetical protein
VFNLLKISIEQLFTLTHKFIRIETYFGMVIWLPSATLDECMQGLWFLPVPGLYHILCPSVYAEVKISCYMAVQLSSSEFTHLLSMVAPLADEASG